MYELCNKKFDVTLRQLRKQHVHDLLEWMYL